MPRFVRSRAARRRGFALFCASAGILGALPDHLRADTAATWDGSYNNWSSAVDWSTNPYYPNNGTPAATSYAVTISSGDITLDVSPTIDSLVLGGTLQTDDGTTLTTGSLNNTGDIFVANGGDLKVSGVTTNSDSFYVGEGSMVSLTGNVTNSDYFFTGYGGGNNTVTMSGTLTNADNLQVTGSGDLVDVATLINQGIITTDANTTLNITGGGMGVTDIPAGVEYDLGGNFNVINGGTLSFALAHLASVEGSLYLLGEDNKLGPLTNSGTIYVGEGANMSLTGSLTNTSTFYEGYGGGNNTFSISGTLTNSGNFSLNSDGDVVNANAISNQGTISTAGGTTLNITGGGMGVTDIPTGTTYVIGGDFNVINGGTLTYALAHLGTVEGILYLLGQNEHMAPLSNSGSIYVGEGSNVSLTGSVTNTATFYTGYAGGNNTVSISGTLTNSGDFSLNSGGDVVNVNALSNTGTISIASGTTFNITGGGTGVTDIPLGAEIYLGGNFNVINGGTPTYALAHLASVEGQLYLLGQDGPLSSLTNSGNFYIGEGTNTSLTGSMTNTGTFYTGYAAGNNTFSVSGTLTNSGYISLNDTGDVVNANAISNQGSITIGSGTTLNITGGGLGVTDIPLGSTYVIGGTFNVINGPTATNALTHLGSVEGLLYLEDQNDTLGTVTSSGSIYVGAASTLSLTGNLTSSGTFYTGYISGNNDVNVAGTLNNQGNLSLNSAGDVINANAMNNSGTTSLGSSTTLNITGGSTMTFAAGNSTVNVNGTLTNTGTLDAGGPMTVYKPGRVNINGGSVTVGGLSIAGGGVVNVNASLVINFGSPANDPISTIVSELSTGYHGATAWTGTSGTAGVITSSSAAAGGKAVSVGYLDGNIDTTDSSEVAPNQIVVKYALTGDTNLDGIVNFTDFATVLKYFAQSGTDWAEGDFTYNPNSPSVQGTNFTDFADVLANFLQPFPGGGGGETLGGTVQPLATTVQILPTTAALPEPTSLSLVAAGAAGLLSRRRRRA